MDANPVYLMVTMSAFFWGANFVLAGPVLADLPPLWAAAFRFILGALIMFAIASFRREDLMGLLRRHLGAYLLLGSVGITAFNLLFFHALQSTSADNGALIMATNPLLTTLLAALFLGERPTSRHLLALPVALGGVAIVVAQGDLAKLASLQVSTGDLLMLAANLAWALYNVLGRRFMPPGSSLGNTTLVMAAGALLLFSVAMGSGDPVHMPGIKAGLALAVMVAGGTVLACLFWSIGIQRLEAHQTSRHDGGSRSQAHGVGIGRAGIRRVGVSRLLHRRGHGEGRGRVERRRAEQRAIALGAGNRARARKGAIPVHAHRRIGGRARVASQNLARCWRRIGHDGRIRLRSIGYVAQAHLRRRQAGEVRSADRRNRRAGVQL